MINTFTRSSFKSMMGWLLAMILLVIATGCGPGTPEAEEGGGLGGSGEEIEEEGVEEGEEEEEEGEED